MGRQREPPKEGRKGRRFLAKQGKIYHGAAAGYGKLPPKEGSGAGYDRGRTPQQGDRSVLQSV